MIKNGIIIIVGFLVFYLALQILSLVIQNWTGVLSVVIVIIAFILFIILFAAVIDFLISFGKKNQLKEKELQLKEKELEIRQKKFNENYHKKT